MSNRSYLAASDTDTIYPSFVQKDYNAEQQLIATDVEALPLMWLALFREDDLRREVFKVQGEDVPAFAPVCEKDKALRQLEQAVPYLAKLFPQFAGIDEYAKMLQAAIEPLPYRYVSIELEEIAGLYPQEHRFEELLTLGLRGFDRPDEIRFHCDDVTWNLSGLQVSVEPAADEELDEEMEAILADLRGGSSFTPGQESAVIPGFTANSHADVLERLATLNVDAGLPSVRMYLDNLEYSDEDQWNFTRVLGAGRYGSMGFGRETPWEKEDANYGWEFISHDDDFDDE